MLEMPGRATGYSYASLTRTQAPASSSISGELDIAIGRVFGNELEFPILGKEKSRSLCQLRPVLYNFGYPES